MFGLSARTKTVNQLRDLLTEKGFAEFIPPLIDRAQPTEPTIYQFKIGKYYLATSPEGFMKKHVLPNFNGNCFAVSHCFRAMEGESRLHRPDFLMCEFYIYNATYLELMDFTEELIAKILKIKKKIKKISLMGLWQKYLNVDPTKIDLIKFAKERGYSIDNADWEALFTQIHFNEIEKHYPKGPFFLVDFPQKTSPLCEPQKGNPELSERFELIIDKIELANGNTERFDPRAVQTIMAAECTKRGTPVDYEFIAALKKLEGKKWAGVGLGVDRLCMLQNNIRDIRDLSEV
jgi:elongation factor P--beta-lysine ligase